METNFDKLALNINNKDLPPKNLDLFAATLANPKMNKKKEIALEFVKKLEQAFKEGNLSHMSYLYDFVFNKLSDTVFKTVKWPSPNSLKKGVKIHKTVKLLYKELCNRHMFARLSSQIDMKTRLRSFENYVKLLTMTWKPKELDKNQLPADWIWDMLDEFIYQYISFCFYKTKLNDKSEVKEKALITEENIPNLNQIEKILDNFIKESGILGDDGQFTANDEKFTTAQILGYYSYFAKIKLYISTANFDKAGSLVANVDYGKIKVFTKSWSCVTNLFYFSAISMLKNHQFIFCGRFLEQIISFYLKYNHFFTKSFQYDSTSRLIDRSVNLLIICMSVNNMEIDETVRNFISEKNSEKLEKLLQYDITTFEECLAHGCVKVTQPITNLESLNVSGNKYYDPFRPIQKELVKEFSKAVKLNNTEFVLSLYPKVDLAKFAKMMNVNENQAKELIESYNTNKNPDTNENILGKTFFKKCHTDLRKINFELNGNQIEIKELEAKKYLASNLEDYISSLEKMNAKIMSF